MDQGEYLITLTRDGRVRVQVTGVAGERCLELAELIRELVGREERRELTAEYYQGEVQVQEQTRLRQTARQTLQ